VIPSPFRGGAAAPTGVSMRAQCPGRSGRLAAKQDARSQALSRRGRRSYREGVNLEPLWKHRPGRSGRLAAKQNARSQALSRRGRRSYQIWAT